MARRLLLTFGLAMVLSAIGAAAGTPTSVTAADWLKPRLVDIGAGRRLNFACIGEGSPTVVFEQGGEGAIANWDKVQPAVSAMTRACFYDRAGFGFSDPPGRPVTAINVTDDLHLLLSETGVKGPIVLVGHSIGGFYATTYADRFPSEVAGMVLVDPGFSGQFNPKPETRGIEQANIRRGEEQLRRCATLALHGRLSEDRPRGCFGIEPDRPAEERAYLLHAFTHPGWYEAERSQSRNFFPHGEGDSLSMRQEEALSHPFGHMPLIVLTSGIPPRDPVDTDDSWRWKSALWKRGHEALAARSQDGKALVVAESHHFIQRDRPQAVIDAVEEVIKAVRRGQATDGPLR